MMPHEIDKEGLTAYLDGQLPEAECAALAAHLAACPECASYLERVKASAAAFRKHGAERLPAKVMARAMRTPSSERAGWALALAFSVLLLFLASAGVKHFMPQLFSSIQGMISSAAGNMGSGGH